jgi:hypothetical protein
MTTYKTLEYPKICPCKKYIFKSYKNITFHINGMGKCKLKWPYCKICKKNYYTKKLLRRHISNNHATSSTPVKYNKFKKYKCPECNQSNFASFKEFVFHNNNHIILNYNNLSNSFVSSKL